MLENPAHIPLIMLHSSADCSPDPFDPCGNPANSYISTAYLPQDQTFVVGIPLRITEM